MKISIIGIGRVGTALGLALVARHLVDDLVLVGNNAKAVEAEALDLLHATAFGRPTYVRAGGVDATAGSDVITLCIGARTAGPARSAGAPTVYVAMQNLLPALAAASPDAILLIASNPVDALTTLAGPLTGFPASRVIGSGTLLDTMRLRLLLSKRLGIHPQDIRAYVIGEHGDSQFAAFSSASAGGGRLALAPDVLRQIETAARHVGHEIFVGKGYTNHGIALAVAEIIESIARDSHQVMPLSGRIENFTGLGDVCLSLPVVVGRAGILRRIAIELSQEEMVAFQRSASVVREMIQTLQTAPIPNDLSGEPIDASNETLG